MSVLDEFITMSVPFEHPSHWDIGCEFPFPRQAFEHLVKIELFTRADAKPVGKTMKEYCLMNLVVETSQIREALMKYQDCPTAVQIWAFQEVSSNRAQRSA